MSRKEYKILVPIECQNIYTFQELSVSGVRGYLRYRSTAQSWPAQSNARSTKILLLLSASVFFCFVNRSGR